MHMQSCCKELREHTIKLICSAACKAYVNAVIHIRVGELAVSHASISLSTHSLKPLESRPEVYSNGERVYICDLCWQTQIKGVFLNWSEMPNKVKKYFGKSYRLPMSQGPNMPSLKHPCIWD